jgi:hypothetical protein
VPGTASRICNTVSDPPADLHLSEVASDLFKSSAVAAWLCRALELACGLGYSVAGAAVLRRGVEWAAGRS